jgi:hypothetical protein
VNVKESHVEDIGIGKDRLPEIKLMQRNSSDFNMSSNTFNWGKESLSNMEDSLE